MRFNIAAVAFFLAVANAQSDSIVPTASLLSAPGVTDSSAPTDTSFSFDTNMLPTMTPGASSIAMPTGAANPLLTCCSDLMGLIGGCYEYFVQNPSKYPSGNLINEEAALLSCLCAQSNLVSVAQSCGTCIEKQDPSIMTMSLNSSSYSPAVYQNACADPVAYLQANTNSSLFQAQGADLPLSDLALAASYLPTTMAINTNFNPTAGAGSGAGSTASNGAASTPGSTAHSSSDSLLHISGFKWMSGLIGIVAFFMMAM